MVRTVVWAAPWGSSTSLADWARATFEQLFRVFFHCSAQQKFGTLLHPNVSDLKPTSTEGSVGLGLSSQANNAILCVENLGERLINLVGRRAQGGKIIAIVALHYGLIKRVSMLASVCSPLCDSGHLNTEPQKTIAPIIYMERERWGRRKGEREKCICEYRNVHIYDKARDKTTLCNFCQKILHPNKQKFRACSLQGTALWVACIFFLLLLCFLFSTNYMHCFYKKKKK